MRPRTRNEIQTPGWLVKKMVDLLEENDKPIDLCSTFLEPTCWGAPFAREVLDRKLKLCCSYDDVLTAYKSVYGYELMPDNLEEGKANMMRGFENDKNVRIIVNTNFVLMDAFTGLDPETGKDAEFYDWNKSEWFTMPKIEH